MMNANMKQDMSSTSRASQQQIFAEISAHNGLIYKVCYMYAEDGEHLKDLYQEVMANLWQGIGSFDGKSKLSTWIYRVALNTCISYLRKNSRHKSHEPLSESAMSVIDESHEHAEMLRTMYEMISRLGKIDKAIIMLWLDEYSYDEIAALTGMTRNNVASRIHRIKQRLINSND